MSLCEAEASVAAPMTSRNQTIASMVDVVAEGRCTLMATYQIFQFIIGYALVQAFSANLMYTYALNIGNYQVGARACTPPEARAGRAAGKPAARLFRVTAALQQHPAALAKPSVAARLPRTSPPCSTQSFLAH